MPSVPKRWGGLAMGIIFELIHVGGGVQVKQLDSKFDMGIDLTQLTTRCSGLRMMLNWVLQFFCGQITVLSAACALMTGFSGLESETTAGRVITQRDAYTQGRNASNNREFDHNL